MGVYQQELGLNRYHKVWLFDCWVLSSINVVHILHHTLDCHGNFSCRSNLLWIRLCSRWEECTMSTPTNWLIPRILVSLFLEDPRNWLCEDVVQASFCLCFLLLVALSKQLYCFIILNMEMWFFFACLFSFLELIFLLSDYLTPPCLQLKE